MRLSLQHFSSLSMFPLQELAIGVSKFTCKKAFKLSIKSLAKIRFLTSKSVDHRVRDVGMLLLPVKTNELSRYLLEIRSFTLEIKSVLSLLLKTIPKIKIHVIHLHFKPIYFKLSRWFWTKSSLSRQTLPRTFCLSMLVSHSIKVL